MKYLLDTNLLKEIGKAVPHANVQSWLDMVDDSDLAISVVSIREIWKGIERKRAGNPELATRLEAAVLSIQAAFTGRILAVDENVARQWGIMLGQSDKHVDDTGLAATAKVH
ncbi:VapC toxin family PIN domain ribonuclease [Labrys sp. LIt4]|uniref:VapC toxin family PIN domain ribonuclease n=1 Tax=Labrys sp. LIt4 TaxID=2821355 RepID=UPI001ADFAFEF|nr:VapC toxin family PIN domain ribonuclease [Labrys sp. LIt4]MBP0579669.1 VapC toxin family PIN domain ribonuclease [Labrys sp. LIt4]